MNANPRRPICGLRVLALLCGALMLHPAPASAQDYFLENQFTLYAEDATPVNLIFNTGMVQDTNLLVSTGTATQGRVTTSGTGTSSYGALLFTASSSVDAPVFTGTGCGGLFGPYVGGGNDVQSKDTLWFVSDTLPIDTPVNVVVTMVYTGWVTAPFATSPYSPDGITSGASFTGYVASNPEQTGTLTSVNTTNQLTFSVTSVVGTYLNGNQNNALVIRATIQDSLNNDDGDAAVYNVTGSTYVASQTYVNVLTPNVTYMAESGTTYPALQLTAPQLNIQASGANVLLTWPVTTPAYNLLQSSNLITTNWTACTNPVTVVNGTNQVTYFAAGASEFFMLSSQ